MTASVAGTVLGSQAPRVRSVPASVSPEFGDAAVELAALAGSTLDDWQALTIRDAMGVRDGRWSAFEVGVVVSRQNGKGEILLARELAGLFVMREALQIHTAHQFKTTTEHFLRVSSAIENTDALRKRCKKPRTSHGEEQIETLDGCRLKFVARSRSSARGFTGDNVVLDEAFELPDAAIAALMPTLSAKSITGNPQIWYTSSAVNQAEHPNGLVLARLRKRGLTGTDPSLAYLEWSVDEDVYKADPAGVAADERSWADSNPGLGIRISPEHVAREHRSMDPRTFAVERLSVGDWPDPDGGDGVIASSVWAALLDRESKPAGSVAFAVDASPDRGRWSIASAGLRADGKAHVDLVENQPGEGWVLGYLLELVDTFKPLAVALDPGSPAGSLLPGLVAAGVEVYQLPTREVAQACGSFYDAVVGDRLRHLEQPALATALAGAKKRDLADAWAWSRKNSSTDISPLVAVTFAHWAYQMKRNSQEGPPNLW